MKKLFSLMIAVCCLGIFLTGCRNEDEPTLTPDITPQDVPDPVSKEIFDKNAVGKLWVFDEMHYVGYDGSSLKYEDYMPTGESVASRAYFFSADGTYSEYKTVMFGKMYFGVENEKDQYCVISPFEYNNASLDDGNSFISAVTESQLVIITHMAWQKNYSDIFPDATEEDLEKTYLKITYKPQSMEESESWRSHYTTVHKE